MSIQMEKVTYQYNPGTIFEKKALDQINLTILTGEFFGIIGHTGSGKSTLIQLLNALLRPTAGKILIDGEDISAKQSNLKSLRQKVGLVFQYPEYQLFEATVFQDVAYGPSQMGLSAEEIKKRVTQALQLVGMDSNFYQKSPFLLSGGQKRRVAIAGILAMEPKILVLDEPTAGLDPKGREEILSVIKKMHQSLGITVVFVSHSMEDIARFADRIGVLHDGKLAFLGTPQEVFCHQAELEQMGLALPEISYVLQGLKKKGFEIPEGVYTLAEGVEYLTRFLSKEEKT